MTTPNTTGPSDEIQRYLMFDVETHLSSGGNVVLHSDHLAALSRARDEARREALEEAAKVCLDERRGHYLRDDPTRMDAAGYCYHRIRALIPTTPQGETKEQQP